jgi:hypothetical protein
MAYKIKNTIKKTNKSRYFDSIESQGDVASNWLFKYITLNTAGQDATTHPDPPDIEIDKSKYPQPIDDPLGTIFFDSGSESIYLSNTISNVIIDRTKPEFVSEDVQYLTFGNKRKCKFTIKSNSLIDVCQLIIGVLEYKNGDIDNPLSFEPLYRCQRKEAESIIYDDHIHNITYQKTGDTYTLYFELDTDLDLERKVEKIDEHTEDVTSKSICIQIWNIAGNSATYITSDSWKNVEGVIDDLKPLIIEFIDVNPKSKIISANVEGKVRVKVTNPNKELWSIQPTVKLTDKSIGYIDESQMEYNPETGILLFYVTHINSNGILTVEAWIDVENSEIADYVKQKTYAKESLGPFMFADEGRKYKFNGYTPTYLNDELYKSFVQYVQDFLNTSQFSLNNGHYISTLEKIARINNFNDPIRIENPLLTEYTKQYNIEVNPVLDKYVYYLNHQTGDSEEEEE